MAALTGNSIDSSYQGLLKTTDNGAVGGASKAITDGLGNATNIEIGNAVTKFPSGTVDFTGSTVQGLPAGAAGLESGTGTDSMQSAASLTTTAADSQGTTGIALGNGAISGNGISNIAIGNGADGGSTGDNYSIAIGNNAQAGDGTIAMGNNAGSIPSDSAVIIGNSAEGSTRTVSLGRLANASGANSISIGNESLASGSDSIAIGISTDVSGNDAVAIGNNVESPNNDDVNIGTNNLSAKTGLEGDVIIGKDNNSSTTNGGQNVMIGQSNEITQNERSNVIGYDNTVSRGSHSIVGEQNTSSSNYQIAIFGNNNTSTGEKSFVGGHNSGATATGAVALGDGVTASTAQTVSVKALETQTNSTPTAGGIIMSDAGGTDRRINIDASGALQIDSTPVGGGGGSTSHPARYFGTGNLSTTFEGPYTFFSNDIVFFAVHLQEGEEVTELAVELGAAFTNTTSIGMALYDSQIGTSTVEYVPNNKLLDLGTASPSTIGVKTFTGSTYTATYTGMYFIALGYNGQWDGTFRQVDSGQRSYHPDTYYISNTTLGFARDFNIAEPLRYAASYNDSMPASFAASQSFSNTSARLALMGKTAQNI